MDTLRIFLGFDPREAAAFYVCQQSILEHTKAQVSFHPVRGDIRDGSNTFTYERFMVPYRCGFRGIAIFLDGDMLVRSDIAELANLAMSDKGCCVVKHDYKTKHPVKYLGYPNQDYPKKNQSSVVVWNCGFFPNRQLTPEFIAKHDGAFLHRFSWLRDDQIGELPMSWNRLVLEQDIQPDDKLRHFTIGTPCFAEYADCDGADEWFATLNRAMEPMKL
jgi:lipopolysaccharide biosynthesis glycosyltransferase